MKIWEFINLGEMKYYKLRRIEYENSEIKKLGYRDLGNNKFAQENLEIQRFYFINIYVIILIFLLKDGYSHFKPESIEFVCTIFGK